ncbi:hypothetical protein ABT061_11515, partial [Streptosporangium sp. NPDC002544]|uniref:hypothetical protein n=1 Tax=Streptosporangium sp. NPDC002544 TaxID=3154538 RepID=UPI00333015A3
MLLARHLLSGAIAVVAASAVTALPAEATVQRPATHTAVAGPAVCVDANGTRTNGTPVHLWQCFAGNTNQKFVIDDGMIKVKDTLGSATPMCVDA